MSTITAEQARKATRRVVYQRLRDEAGQVKRAYPKALEHAFKLIYEQGSKGLWAFNTVRLYEVILEKRFTTNRVDNKVFSKVIRKLLSLGYKYTSAEDGCNFIEWN